jgi:hypothetical protein
MMPEAKGAFGEMPDDEVDEDLSDGVVDPQAQAKVAKRAARGAGKKAVRGADALAQAPVSPAGMDWVAGGDAWTPPDDDDPLMTWDWKPSAAALQARRGITPKP